MKGTYGLSKVVVSGEGKSIYISHVYICDWQSRSYRRGDVSQNNLEQAHSKKSSIKSSIKSSQQKSDVSTTQAFASCIQI